MLKTPQIIVSYQPGVLNDVRQLMQAGISRLANSWHAQSSALNPTLVSLVVRIVPLHRTNYVPRYLMNTLLSEDPRGVDALLKWQSTADLWGVENQDFRDGSCKLPFQAEPGQLPRWSVRSRMAGLGSVQCAVKVASYLSN